MYSSSFVAETILSPLGALGSQGQVQLTVCAGIKYGLSILLHWSVLSIFMPVPHWFNYYRFAVWFEIRKDDAPGSVLPQDCLGYLGSSVIPYKY